MYSVLPLRAMSEASNAASEQNDDEQRSMEEAILGNVLDYVTCRPTLEYRYTDLDFNP